MTDEVPDPLAQLDQLLRGLADMAKAIRTYYKQLRTEGFTHDDALELTVAFQTQIQRSDESQ